VAEAATWDLKMAYEYGNLIGPRAPRSAVQFLVGGGMDITREPRNGRNFEYQGEDPILAGKMAAQFVKGLQSNKVIGDVKHYAFNDQETGRSIGNVKTRAARHARDGPAGLRNRRYRRRAGMVMCSYNKLNGDWACENSYLLTDVLKKAWGFKVL